MNILIWNCQGIANRRTRHALKLLVQSHQVHMVFLSETQRAISFPHMACFDRVDRAGGLALLWDDSIRVLVREVNFFYIDVDVTELEDVQWRFTNCNLDDIGVVGGWFTWSNSNTKERLDRGVCTPAWLMSFSHSQVRALPPNRSYHVPLLLEVRKDRLVCDQEKRPYRFEEIWCSDPDFPRILERAWTPPQAGSPMVQLCRKIKDSGKSLLQWDR
ncbi:hypothetical protein ACLB2K_023065 [Fragaria x ananassa]